MLWQLLFVAGVTFIVVGGIFWLLFRKLPPEVRELAAMPMNESLRALGYEGARLNPLRDGEARLEIVMLGRARAYASYRKIALGGLVLALGSLAGYGLTS